MHMGDWDAVSGIISEEMKGRQMAGIDVVHHQIVPGFTKNIHQWIAGDSDGEFFHFGLTKLASSSAHLDEEKKEGHFVKSLEIMVGQKVYLL